MAKKKKVQLVVPGQTGLDVSINYAGTLTPKEVKAWTPIARVAVALADQVRERITTGNRGPEGEHTPSGLWRTGGMWKSLRVHVTKNHAVVSFSGKSAPAGASTQGRHNRKGFGIDPRVKRAKLKGRRRSKLYTFNNTKMGMVERKDNGKLVKASHLHTGRMDLDYIRRFYKITEGQDLILEKAVEAAKTKILNAKKAAYSQKWLSWSMLAPSEDEFLQVLATLQAEVPRHCIKDAIHYAHQSKTQNAKMKKRLKRARTKLKRMSKP